ncbi:MAG TPA: dihydrodipicolinate synthase family protein [Candidatus Limnocylindrales bacterium]
MLTSDALRGVFNIVPTPFADDGSLDEPSLRRLIDFVVSCGVDGVTILGVLGEAGKVSEAERTRIVEVTLEAAAGRVPVCVGTTHAATDRCIAFSREAEALGANALMVSPPALARTNETAVRRHYLSVADAVGLPIVVQDYPPASGVFMTPAFIGSLAAEHQRLRWLKLEDEPTASKTSAILAANPDVRIFGGLGGMFMLEELRRGAAGAMTGFGFPEILVAIWRRFSAGDLDGATALFYHYLPLIRFENQPGINLALRKHLYRLRGAIASSRARMPYTAADETSLAELEELIDRLGLRDTLTVPGGISEIVRLPA